MIGKAIRELANRTFHFRNALENIVDGISRLDSYAKSTTTKKDSPIKIRQDILATRDVVDLALHLRRLIEVSNMRTKANGWAINTTVLKIVEEKVEVGGGHVNLYDLVSRIIHSRICVASRNINFVIGHFGIGYIPKSLLEGEMSTKAIMIVESDNFEKSLCAIQDFIDVAYKLVDAIAKNDTGISEYLNRRIF